MAVKLVIWDLDDTLWRGTLADGDAVTLFDRRANIVRALNACGIVSSICSKNDFDTAMAQLVAMGLWDEFVFPRIAFTPKPQVILDIIADMQLRAEDVLFVDDNPVNLREAAFCIPALQLLDSTAPNCDAALDALVAAQPATARSRLDDYRMLERKLADRYEAALSNEEFLRSSDLAACAPHLMDNLDFAGRIAELINRSNQLNYTNSRVTVDDLERDIIAVLRFYTWSIFAWDRYGHYGLVGFVMLDQRTMQLEHFTFSCRVMHMGLEAYALAKVRTKYPNVDISPLAGRCSEADADWIEDQSFDDPAVRARLIASHVPDYVANAPLRIMFDCQSGGLAHYSRRRSEIDFDNNPRYFALRSFRDGSFADQHYPPFVVYGAGIDYSDPRWPDAEFLELGIYEWAAHRMAAFLAERGTTTLIVLPCEHAAEGKYRPHFNHTRARTRQFNAIWRVLAAQYSNLTLMPLDGVAEADEMVDVSHYTPALLRRIASHIDDWYEAASAPMTAGQAMAIRH